MDIQDKLKEYVETHHNIQEAIKRLKELKEIRNKRESDIVNFLKENNLSVLDIEDTRISKMFRYLRVKSTKVTRIITNHTY